MIDARVRPRRSVKALAQLCFGSLLLLHCAWLATQKITNFGVLFPAAIAVAMVALGVAGSRWPAWLAARQWRQKTWRLVLGVFVLWLASLAIFFWYLHRIGGQLAPTREAPQLILVLGSSTPNATPSPALTMRLDLALDLARRFPTARVMTSGGVDFGQMIAEADVMAAYLRARGLDVSRTLIENRSTSTHENLAFSQAVWRGQGGVAGARVLVVTNDFHTLRAGWIARKAGWTDVATAGAKTPPYLRYNAWLREYFAIFSGWLFHEF